MSYELKSPLSNRFFHLKCLRDMFSTLSPGCSVARLSRRVWDAEVAGSNPATPTKRKLFIHMKSFFVFRSAERQRSYPSFFGDAIILSIKKTALKKTVFQLTNSYIKINSTFQYDVSIFSALNNS